MSKKIGIIDYGVGNLYSIKKSIGIAGYDAAIVKNLEQLLDFYFLILPGVGAFDIAMERIRNLKIDEAINCHIAKKRPLLGICLGMQLLFSKSYEFGIHGGLDIIKGEVLEIPCKNDIIVPHVGWSSLIKEKNWNHTIFCDITDLDEFYFTHSFTCYPLKNECILASFHYGGKKFVAAIQHNNIMGVQFHPELSSFNGLKVFKRFFSM